MGEGMELNVATKKISASDKRSRGRFVTIAEVPLLAVLILCLRPLMPWIVFKPSPKITLTPADRGMEFEDVTITTSDGVNINGWFVPTPRPRGTLLFFHGNAGNISNRLDSIEIFRELGLSVFIIDYRGYGNSGGRLSFQGVALDALAAWKYLTQTRGVSPGDIVVFGRSIGGAIAMELMRSVKPRALILESTFSSLPDMVRVQFLAPAARFVIGDVWNSSEAAANLTAPVLCLHSPDDGIVPYRLGRRLYEAVASEKTFVELSGGHNVGFLESIDVYRPALDKFLTKRFGEIPRPAN
jgi:fermentation-respiration switch protein FrsA (DUF1100 family)